MDLEDGLGPDDLQRREGDLQLDLHVVDGERVGVVVDVHPRRLLVAHRAADQQPVVGGAERARTRYSRSCSTSRPSGSGGRIGVGARTIGHPLSYPSRAPSLSTRDTVAGVLDRAVRRSAGEHVELVPLAVEQAGELAAAARGDRSTYGFTEVPDGVEAMAAYIAKLLGQQRRTARRVPFAQRRRDRRPAGRLHPVHGAAPVARPAEPDEVEIGGTWLAADAQRTPVNTEAKLLLLTHAFEVWQVWRVALCTDARNERSRRAIERIGARSEGVLRNHRPSLWRGEAGRPRDSALFAITDDRLARASAPGAPRCGDRPGRRASSAGGAPVRRRVRAAMDVLVVCAHPRRRQLHPRRHRAAVRGLRAGRSRRDHARPLRARVRPGDVAPPSGPRTTATSR